jgi:CheY-like chemotaxis protein
VNNKDVQKVSRVGRKKEETNAGLAAIHGARLLLVEDNEISRQVAQEILESAGLNVALANNGLEALEAVKKNKYDAILMDIQMPVMDGYTAARKIREWEGEIRNAEVGMRNAERELNVEDRGRMTDDRSQMAEDRSQKAEDRGQKPEDGSGNWESGMRNAERKLKAQGSKLNGKNSAELSAFSFQPSARAKRVPIIAITGHAMAGDEEKSIQAGMNDHVTKPIDLDQLFDILQKWIKPIQLENKG